MSHLRNLFHKGPGTPVTPIAAGPAWGGGSLSARAAAIQPDSAPIVRRVDFPVEPAQIRPEQRLVFYTEPHSPAADRFRLLRMRLRERQAAGGIRSVLVTSPLEQDGKSTVVMNLATALAERGKRSVLIIDADLHHGRIAESLCLKPWPGVAECLQDHLDPLSHIRRVDPMGWCLLPSGEPHGNPTELLQTHPINGLIQSLQPCFDWIVLDAPPVVPVTDAISLHQHADATLLVVRAGQTERSAIEQSTALLDKKKVVGVVLNAVERRYSSSYSLDSYVAD